MPDTSPSISWLCFSLRIFFIPVFGFELALFAPPPSMWQKTGPIVCAASLGNLNEAELTRWVPHRGGEGCKKWLFPEWPCTWGKGRKWGEFPETWGGEGQAHSVSSINIIKMRTEQPHSQWRVFWRRTLVCARGGGCGNEPATQLNGSHACGRPRADSWHGEQFLNKSEECIFTNTLSQRLVGKTWGLPWNPQNSGKVHEPRSGKWKLAEGALALRVGAPGWALHWKPCLWIGGEIVILENT